MMLHHRADDLVSWLELPLQAVPVGDDVEGLRGGLGEDDLVRGLCSDESRDLFTRPFVLAGRFLSEFVDRPMDVRVVARVEIRRRLNDLLWLLRGRGAVEVNEAAVPNPPLQDWEIGLDCRDVQEYLGRLCHSIPSYHDGLPT